MIPGVFQEPDCMIDGYLHAGYGYIPFVSMYVHQNKKDITMEIESYVECCVHCEVVMLLCCSLD